MRTLVAAGWGIAGLLVEWLAVSVSGVIFADESRGQTRACVRGLQGWF